MDVIVSGGQVCRFAGRRRDGGGSAVANNGSTDAQHRVQPIAARAATAAAGARCGGSRGDGGRLQPGDEHDPAGSKRGRMHPGDGGRQRWLRWGQRSRRRGQPWRLRRCAGDRRQQGAAAAWQGRQRRRSRRLGTAGLGAGEQCETPVRKRELRAVRTSASLRHGDRGQGGDGRAGVASDGAVDGAQRRPPYPPGRPLPAVRVVLAAPARHPAAPGARLAHSFSRTTLGTLPRASIPGQGVCHRGAAGASSR